MRTICNPINISYNYINGYRSRELADPAVIVYRGKYYLFASHGEGYWVSRDLADWAYIRVDVEKHPQFSLFAPAPCVVGERVYLTHSECGTILYSDDISDPDSWVELGKPFDWQDPCFYYEDGYVYLYEGLTTDGRAVTVSKFDPEDGMRLLEGPIPICQSDRAHRGCERRGNHHELDDITYFEGPWMSKIAGRYYLQCAVPGTEFDVYADVCFVADRPMGPFTYCDNSPVSFKSTGFVRGCGHGCLFEDLNGHLWKLQTNDISVNHIFERRISLYPAKVIDGRLYVNTLRADYPMLCPTDNPAPFVSGGVDWELLSYGKTATASSILDEAHAPAMICNEHMATWWSAKTGEPGEWLMLDLEGCYRIAAIQINFADQDIHPQAYGRAACTGYRYLLECSTDGVHWRPLLDRSEAPMDLPHDYIQPEGEIEARYLRLTNRGTIPAGGRLAVSGLRVFGPACGTRPERAPSFTARRCADARDLELCIERVSGAQGYTVRLGVEPGQLYTHYTLPDATLSDVVRIGCLNVGTEYYVSVDAYNEAGTVVGETVIKV